VTLIELLLAVVLISLVIIPFSQVLSRSFQALFSGRQRWEATRLLSGKMEEIRGLQYAVIPLTDRGAWPSPSDPGCDCRSVIWAVMLSSSTQFRGQDWNDSQVSGQITYTRQVCINLVNKLGVSAEWTPHCSDIDELTLGNIRGKNIRVRVSWRLGKETKAIEQESLMTPS
jgi:type II secretory pathway pseudopilin PulG